MDEYNTAELNKAGPFYSLRRRCSPAYTIHAEGGNQYRACQGRALVLCDDDARLLTQPVLSTLLAEGPRWNGGMVGQSF